VAGAQLVLERFAVAAATGATREAAARVVFDDAAWRLAVCGVAPLAICGDGGWLMKNPFNPPASAWMLLPLVGHVGLVIGCTA
jgi:hypothetical protein